MTVIFGAENTTPRTVAPRTAARPAAILPLLVILFIVSYGILTMLVFEQGQTIESQRTLIREMLKDSSQLATLKGKMARDDKRIHVPAQNPGNPATSPDGSDKGSKRSSKTARTMKVVPGKPAADLEDVRRFTGVI